MSQEATLVCELREKTGSRASRKLRAQGRIVGSLQSPDGKPNIDVSFDSAEFWTFRRQHVHLFDLKIGNDSESALVRELQWDAMGDVVLNVEFKRVTRGVATESEVEINVFGTLADGVMTLHVQTVTVSSLPSKIPDSIELNAGLLAAGAHILAKDLVLPEGVELAVDPEMEIGVVSILTEQPEKIADAEDPQGDDSRDGDEG